MTSRVLGKTVVCLATPNMSIERRSKTKGGFLNAVVATSGPELPDTLALTNKIPLWASERCPQRHVCSEPPRLFSEGVRVGPCQGVKVNPWEKTKPFRSSLATSQHLHGPARWHCIPWPPPSGSLQSFVCGSGRTAVVRRSAVVVQGESKHLGIRQ